MRAMVLEGVRLEVPSNVPVMVLREVDAPRRILPIFIGAPEAASIHHATTGIVPERPLTHDLLVGVLRSLEASLQRVVVTEVRDHTYYAELHLSVGERAVTVSCRPSDAVAVAVRTGSPIFAEADLMDEAGRAAPEPRQEEGEETIIDDFRDFINRVSPEDFGG
ncbi:MAG: bifunctional nuclease family protein [Actinobacteria bacterium]|nr:bifunctional nuclease family protein [Actinomycetota bacterium]